MNGRTTTVSFRDDYHSTLLYGLDLRKKVFATGLRKCERLEVNDMPNETHGKRRHHDISPDEENRCDESKKMCYLSAVSIKCS